MKINEIYDAIVEQLINTVTCQHTSSHCQWRITGRWKDSDGDEHTATITTNDEELATGWKEDQYDSNLYAEYERKWAEYLCDQLELVNEY